jgi:hypothetical protein
MKLTQETKNTKEGRRTVREPTRERLLAEYAEKPIRKVFRIDCWCQDHDPHNVLDGDREGHVVMPGETYVPRKTTFPVRAQISEGAEKETVLALLAKAHSLLASDREAVVAPRQNPVNLDDETWS